MRPILGGVGLGICSACRAPGAFWYSNQTADLHTWPGVWLCDSCQWPDAARARIDKHRALLRGCIGCLVDGFRAHLRLPPAAGGTRSMVQADIRTDSSP